MITVKGCMLRMADESVKNVMLFRSKVKGCFMHVESVGSRAREDSFLLFFSSASRFIIWPIFWKCQYIKFHRKAPFTLR